jgi:chromosome segregation ATPase
LWQRSKNHHAHATTAEEKVNFDINLLRVRTPPSPPWTHEKVITTTMSRIMASTTAVVTMILGFQLACTGTAFIIPRVSFPTPSLHPRSRRFVVVFEQGQRTPKPPSMPPPVPVQEEFLERTLKEQEDVAKTVMMLQQKVANLQDELANKQMALETLSASVHLVEQEDEAAERERLEREVEILQGQLPTIQNLWKTEQRRAAELEEKIADLDYTLEYQQMEFEKIQTELKNELEEERQKLSKIEKTMKEQQEKYQTLETESQQQLQSKLQQKEESERALLAKQVEYETHRKRLEDQLIDHVEKVKTLEKELQRQDQLQDAGTLSLQAEIVREREKAKMAKSSLQEMTAQFATIESDLRAQLKSETVRADDLATRLRQEQQRFESTQSRLQTQLQEESFRITALQEQLQTERLDARTKEKLLKDMYENEIRVRRLKKDQMHNRYEQIRTEMTALWQGAIREGKQQAKKLTEKYEGVIGELQSTIVNLERDVMATTEENSVLRNKLDQITSEREAAQNQRRQSENDFQRLISSQSVEIESLQTDLKHVLDIVDEKEHEMASFRSSWRALLKASVKLTLQRVFVKPVSSLRQRIRGRRGRSRHRDDNNPDDNNIASSSTSSSSSQ